MKTLKALSLGAAMLLGTMAMQAEFTYAPYEGLTPSAGGYLGFGGYGTSVEFSVAGQVRLGDWLRLAPEATLSVPSSGYKNCYAVSINAHSPWSVNEMFDFEGPVINVYPIVGLTARHAGYDFDIDARSSDTLDGFHLTGSATGYGVNLGAGAEMFITEKIKANVEFVEQWVSNGLSSFPVKIGVQYLF